MNTIRANDNKMNLLIIMPDQMRADYLGCYGHPTIGTKNIDRLATEGLKFDNCYCAAPLCGPSRISFVTSTYFSEHDHRNYGSTVEPDIPNIVTSLKNEGYITGMFGKNHCFTYERLEEIWDEVDEICVGNYDEHPEFKHSFTAFSMEEDHVYNLTGKLTDQTIDFMSRHSKEKPFLAWVNYQDPHPAFTCPPPYNTMFDPRDMPMPKSYEDYKTSKSPIRNHIWRIHSEMELATEYDIKKAIAMYMGQIRYVDDSVGRMMDYLEETGLSENTIVVFLADHGELLGDHGMTHKNPTFYDALTKIPLIIKYPNADWKLKSFNGLMEEVDIVPSILDMLNIDIPPTMVGKSWVKDIEEGNDKGKDTVICEAGYGAPTYRKPVEGLKLKAPVAPTCYGPGAMIRRGDWKLTIYYDDQCELYYIKEDPHEMNNLYDDNSVKDIRNELTLLLTKRLLGVKVRDVGLQWPYDKYPHDVRCEPLEHTIVYTH
ncbi:MAG: sulfatase-like hydrolase/transferase [Vallitalea sp.]|jgi:arylsulfatase A-like enzyme|nr:sulfatase-like hydrolase/transferase [Vallitalea sp.]